jgi:hypothetical protein
MRDAAGRCPSQEGIETAVTGDAVHRFVGIPRWRFSADSGSVCARFQSP